MRIFLSAFAALIAFALSGQNYWQQRVEYKMDIDFDVESHQFEGKQTLKYFNNSPDTLTQVFYHLYFNAFQPGSMMDTRSRTISDPDGRVQSRISQLQENEIGYHKVSMLKQDGNDLEYTITETVLQAKLNQPLLPGESTVFTMEFNSQVPLQIRRSGRSNREGVDYSMSQWFPKLAEYDEDGWHAHPYVGREFYAPWGKYEVNITIDKDYVLGGTGVVQNPNEVGAGYEDAGVKVKTKSKTKTWKFLAENVHDFVWAADADYTHIKRTMKDGLVLHFLYIPSDKTSKWKELPDYTEKAFDYIEANFGEYPFPQYSVIQGGDGGMEYPMATLITGERGIRSLVGVTVHEAIHSWYQGLLATNESYFAWMDEGFTTYASAETMSHLFNESGEPQKRNYANYVGAATSSRFNEEPLSTHADHFVSNGAYGFGSYTKGSVVLGQLRYIVGMETFKKALKKYYYQWRFKHPDMNDFKRVFEKESGMELDWYFEYFVNTTHTIDYAIKSVEENNGQTSIQLQRVGKMPMPLDLTITKSDGTKIQYYAPLVIMHGAKPDEFGDRIQGPDWPWTHPYYTVTLDIPMSEIKSIQIDEKGWMADVVRSNNLWQR